MSRIVSQLAARLEHLSSALLDLVVVGPHRPVAQFRREPLVNGIYVVHAPHGAILLSGLILETDTAATQGARADRIDALGSAGFASTYRVVDLGTVDLARGLSRIVFDLFGGAFPLSQDPQTQSGSDAETAARVADVPEAPAFRKRGRPRKEEPDAVAAAVSPTLVEAPAPAAKKRGRPAKIQPAAAALPYETESAGSDDAASAGQPSVSGEPSGTINSDAPVATLVDLKSDAPSASPSAGETPSVLVQAANDDDSTIGRDPDEGANEPVLQMTKNQRREKRRRELALLLLKNGEG